MMRTPGLGRVLRLAFGECLRFRGDGCCCKIMVFILGIVMAASIALMVLGNDGTLPYVYYTTGLILFIPALVLGSCAVVFAIYFQVCDDGRCFVINMCILVIIILSSIALVVLGIRGQLPYEFFTAGFICLFLAVVLFCTSLHHEDNRRVILNILEEGVRTLVIDFPRYLVNTIRHLCYGDEEDFLQDNPTPLVEVTISRPPSGWDQRLESQTSSESSSVSSRVSSIETIPVRQMTTNTRRVIEALRVMSAPTYNPPRRQSRPEERRRTRAIDTLTPPPPPPPIQIPGAISSPVAPAPIRRSRYVSEGAVATLTREFELEALSIAQLRHRRPNLQEERGWDPESLRMPVTDLGHLLQRHERAARGRNLPVEQQPRVSERPRQYRGPTMIVPLRHQRPSEDPQDLPEQARH